MESFEKQKLNRQEKREMSFENREAEQDEELKAAAQMERVDFLTKEIKSGNQQIKNIMLHMNEVLNAIKLLRTQLQLPAKNDDDLSIEQDKKQLEKIKNKIKNYKNEILKMKNDLLKIQIEVLREEKIFSENDLQNEAEKRVEELLKILAE
ncbi:MAG: hypothetical protein WC414_03820 [Patescibacteria group bacterium]